MNSLGYFDLEDLEKDISGSFLTSPNINPENSLLSIHSQGGKLPLEADRGFKINGNWYDGREFLREDCARVHPRTDMRRRGSDQNLQLDYE